MVMRASSAFAASHHQHAGRVRPKGCVEQLSAILDVLPRAAPARRPARPALTWLGLVSGRGSGTGHPLVVGIIPCCTTGSTSPSGAALAAATDDVEIELVLIDNGTTDGTTTDYLPVHRRAEVPGAHQRREPRLSPAPAAGLPWPTPAYTLLLNNDTEVTPGFPDARIGAAHPARRG